VERCADESLFGQWWQSDDKLFEIFHAQALTRNTNLYMHDLGLEVWCDDDEGDETAKRFISKPNNRHILANVCSVKIIRHNSTTSDGRSRNVQQHIAWLNIG
jgi:hypothetical protein